MDLPPADQPAIVVTASRSPEAAGDSPASVTIIDGDRIDRLGDPLVPSLLRLVPSASVSTSGPAGSLTQVRIRGAEANHTLLFIDGIRANDPAAGNEPRFELLNADIADRVEVVRGPQSALWGSEAIGGVVAVDGVLPGKTMMHGNIEAGSFDSWRGAMTGRAGTDDAGIAFAGAAQQSDGIDSFDGRGDRDGYRNRALRFAARYRLSDRVRIGANGFGLWGLSEFDGYDPITFLRADTRDESRYRLTAGRVFAEAGSRKRQYVLASASVLGSSNRNSLAGDPINRTSADRRTLSLEGGMTRGRSLLIIAAEDERETFKSRDVAYGGFTDQDRSRSHRSITAEWKVSNVGPASFDVAIRHDAFNRFKDATSLRASASLALGGGFSLAANYGEGIAQPTFFDLYGFFPGSFVGNPDLRPERSEGGEISLRFAGHQLGAAVTIYRQQLDDEIVDVFDNVTFLSTTANANSRSRRRGAELEAYWRPSDAMRLTATYAYLNADEPSVTGGKVKEQRRPKHSGSVALDGRSGRFSYGTAITYTGPRIDTDFDLFPAQRQRLLSYWLAGGQLAYRLTLPVEITLRVANAFDSKYRDVVGYRTEGRSIHAGLRVALGR